MQTCANCGSPNSLVQRGTRWHCLVCRTLGAQPAPSEEEIEELKAELRRKHASTTDDRLTTE